MSSPQCLKIAVLGGSSPFTAGLIDALVQNEFDGTIIKPSPELMLHGRSTKSLSLVGQYASHWLVPLDWDVHYTTDLARALEGADVVVHQIRYGDLAGRAVGEKLCRKIGLPADETLGPAALLTAIRTVSKLEITCKAIRKYCPEARVLNLTNPLSAMTWYMTEMGVRHCVGLCELPLVTKLQAAKILDLDPAEDEALHWTYAGLNHRGFIDTLRLQDRDLLPELIEAMRFNNQAIGGIGSETVADLRAVPLKYFELVLNSSQDFCSPTANSGRAQQLRELRRQVASELQASVKVSPPSLTQRYMDWYPRSVVPLLSAMCQDRATQHMLSMRNGDGLVEEVAAKVQSGKWIGEFRKSSNAKVCEWNEQFKVHERAFLNAMLEPSSANVRIALDADPTVPESMSVEATNTLIQYRNSQ